jgi:hypothetical protein
MSLTWLNRKMLRAKLRRMERMMGAFANTTCVLVHGEVEYVMATWWSPFVDGPTSSVIPVDPKGYIQLITHFATHPRRSRSAQ